MPPSVQTVFQLPHRLRAKADPALIADDEHHFEVVAQSLEHSLADLEHRLADTRRHAARSGQQALDRDQEVHRLTARLRALRRFGVDLCLGRIVHADGAVYIGRLGLTDPDGARLLVDWRSPAAEPFFAATHADPMGLTSRRRYRWADGRITDYWDEAFTAEGLEHGVALDDQSAFIASLGTSRSPRMRDVLSTIQADQDAIIRAGSSGVLVVDGGPGTGKTVVALHRAAYLLYADPRLGHHRGGVLFVGPHQPYLAYVADVLPSLGEEGVQTCTLRELVPEGREAADEPDRAVALLKESAAMSRAIDTAVRFYEDPPTAPLLVETEWGDVELRPDDWAEAFGAPDPGTGHNEARDRIWDDLVVRIADRIGDVPDHELRAALQRDRALVTALGRAWPALDATEIVGDLWTVPAFLRHCAPWLGPDEIRLLQRDEPTAWTTSDLPLLDAARHRLGQAARPRDEHALADAALERETMDRVVADLIASDESEMAVMSMLRGQDAQNTLRALNATADERSDLLSGPFAHVVVDEAQELTDAQWQMLARRCPSQSFTVVGDRAQARHGFTEPWPERLRRVGLGRARLSTLTVNYRTPAEIMAEAEPVIRAALPDANVPTSVRQSGRPVVHARADELDAILQAWLDGHDEGIACVIGGPPRPDSPRVRRLSPELCKGLEFDLVVLAEPGSFGRGVEGAVDHYVAMTRATQHLVVLDGT